LGNVRGVRGVFFEWSRIGDLARRRANLYAQAELVQLRKQLLVKRCHGARVKRNCARFAATGLDQQPVIDEVELEFARPRLVWEGRGRETAGSHVKGRVPRMIDPRCLDEPYFPDHLRPQVECFVYRSPLLE